MKSLIQNYINGNLSDAKRQARNYSLQKLVDGFAGYGYGLHAAYDIANYLKGYGTFEAACQSEAADSAN